MTGRRDAFHTNRVHKGLSGFPKRSESEFDTFGVGHSSTSISAALGMSVANKIKGDKRQHIAVIGDGAMTAGLAFEGLNHGGWQDNDMIVILNDNCMSIDPNVGALKDFLTDITTSHTYNRVKDEVWQLLGKISKFGPDAQTIASKVSDMVKGSLLKQSNLFESLNFRTGPSMATMWNRSSMCCATSRTSPVPSSTTSSRPRVKATPAEAGSPQRHAPGLFNKDTGEIIKVAPKSPEPPKYQDVFGHTIIEPPKRRAHRGVPAMPTGCSLKFMMEARPDRAFDVGIAEQHAVTFSAGMATKGWCRFATSTAPSCSGPTTRSCTTWPSKSSTWSSASIVAVLPVPTVRPTTGFSTWRTCAASPT